MYRTSTEETHKSMPESWESRLMRWSFSLFVCYAGTGGRVTYIASDWREMRVEVPLSFWTRNIVGTIFGGSMFGATDPMFMFMLMKILGKDYIVWDKAGSIRFKKPGRSTLYGQFVIAESDLQEIHAALVDQPKTERTFQANLVDKNGEIHATIERLIHIRRKEPTSK